MNFEKLYEKYQTKAKAKGKKPKSFEKWKAKHKEKQQPEPILNSNRTYQEFVEDMIADGRTLEQIGAVAANTRWSSQKTDICAYAENLLKKLKKVG